ncbi:Cell division protein kinase 10 [Trichuris trichiura]|uniref:Cell division protein kinase 10 n=1 Tax=Trichuris trichiura TaxID=36087 RepID=A0A077Z1P8_TRITR|nr:Cell division protein kinase 10 [Trichuris trichiura]
MSSRKKRLISLVEPTLAKSQKQPVIMYTSIKTGSAVSLPTGNDFRRCRPVYSFERLNQIGEGTYGVVYRARDTETGEIVALKKMRTTCNQEGIPLSSLREVNILLNIRHRNIIRLIDVAVSRDIDTFYLVLEYCEQDLANLMDNMTVPFTESQTKCLALQILEGLKFLHKQFIVHRDLKMSNLLLTNDGCLKIADFGLARYFGIPTQQGTPNVVTLWYRAPEILLESRLLSTAIDIWAAGCILCELLLHKPFLPGQSQMHQIQLMVNTFGTPTEAIWPGLSKLPALRSFSLEQQPYNTLKTIFTSLSANGLKLLHSMFVYDPAKRATAAQCLDSVYFKEPPYPCKENLMPTFPQHRNLKRRFEQTSTSKRRFRRQ